MWKRIFCIIGNYYSVSHALVLEDVVKNHTLHALLSHKKVGYYIGSFDPFHLGHEEVVSRILSQTLCDYILVYPAWGGDRYKNRTDVKTRMQMLFNTFQKHPRVIVTKMTPIELQHTLMKPDNTLIAGKPSVISKINDIQHIGIVGSDVLIETSKDTKKLSVFMMGIHIPKKYEEHTIGGIIAIPVKSFIVAMRGQDDINQIGKKFRGSPIIKVLKPGKYQISSTCVRQKIKENQAISELVNPKIQKSIVRNALYKK